MTLMKNEIENIMEIITKKLSASLQDNVKKVAMGHIREAIFLMALMWM